jgi:hypothetical protein
METSKTPNDNVMLNIKAHETAVLKYSPEVET